MIVVQRPDIFINMLYKQKFKKLILACYKNDVTPTFRDNIFVYDIVAEEEIIPKLWIINISNVKYEAEYPEVEFIFDDYQKVYGYLVYEPRWQKVIWSERFFAAPFILSDGGGSITIKPKVEFIH